MEIHYGYRVLRPECMVKLVEGPPPTLAERLWDSIRFPLRLTVALTLAGIVASLIGILLASPQASFMIGMLLGAFAFFWAVE